MPARRARVEMEVRTIKTCDGWKEVLFLNGALLHPSAEPLDVAEVVYEKLKMLQMRPSERAVLEIEERTARPELERMFLFLSDLNPFKRKLLNIQIP